MQVLMQQWTHTIRDGSSVQFPAPRKSRRGKRVPDAWRPPENPGPKSVDPPCVESILYRVMPHDDEPITEREYILQILADESRMRRKQQRVLRRRMARLQIHPGQGGCIKVYPPR